MDIHYGRKAGVQQGYSAEAKEHDENTIGVYSVTKQFDVANQKKILVGHISKELLRFMKNFLQANTQNKLVAQITRKREIGLVVPAKFSAFITYLRLLRKFWRQSYAKDLKVHPL